MLPTGRKFSQTATYSLMNLSDLFTQLILTPRSGLSVRIDLHRVALANAADRWYGGSGAIQESGTIFGFSARPSNGATNLGTTLETSATYAITPRWSVCGFVGFMKGGDVVRRLFADNTLTFAYIENQFGF